MTSIITLCIVVITFVAISVIITKAGFSRGWALIPLTPLLTWIVTLVVAKIQLHSFVIVWELAPLYPHTIGLLLDVDKIAIFASSISFSSSRSRTGPRGAWRRLASRPRRRHACEVQCEVVQALLRARCNVNLRVTRCPKVQDSEHWASLRVPAQQRTKWSRTSPPNPGGISSPPSALDVRLSTGQPRASAQLSKRGPTRKILSILRKVDTRRLRVMSLV